MKSRAARLRREFISTTTQRSAPCVSDRVMYAKREPSGDQKNAMTGRMISSAAPAGSDAGAIARRR